MILPFLPFYLYKFDPRAHVCYELRNKNCYKIQDGTPPLKFVPFDLIMKKCNKISFINNVRIRLKYPVWPPSYINIFMFSNEKKTTYLHTN